MGGGTGIGNVSSGLKRLGTKERRAQTERAARTLRVALKVKAPAFKPQMRPQKPHDPKGRISKLPKLMVGDVKKNFPRVYREIWPAQDEFVRTSLVTDLLVVLEKAKLPPAEMQVLSQMLWELSLLRFPTKWSGFKFKQPSDQSHGFSVMQHPTAPGAGIWDRGLKGFSKAHTGLDEARLRLAVDVINSFIQTDFKGVITLKPGVTPQQIVVELIRQVGTFTLRFFTGPALADNLDATASKTEREQQTQLREYVKDGLERLGAKRAGPPPGVVIPKLNLPTRDWRPDQLNPGEISPRRGPPVSDADALALWSI